MADPVVCTEADGPDKIIAALAAAEPGEVIEVGAGTFEFKQTLTIPTGVTFRGAGPNETHLIFDVIGRTINIDGVENVTVEGFRIVNSAAIPDGNEEREPSPDVVPINEAVGNDITIPLIYRSKLVSFRSIILSADGETAVKNGLSIGESSQVSLSQIELTHSRNKGLKIWTVADIEINSCLVSNADLDGIAAADVSGVSVRDCHFNSNAGCGLIFMSSVDCRIQNNTCRSNDGMGMQFSPSPDSKKPTVEADISGNRCHENASSGIAISRSATGTIRSNTCFQNEGGSGIYLEQVKPTEGTDRSVLVIKNRCFGNKFSGVTLASSKKVEVRSNTCWSNNNSGISITIFKHTSEVRSDADLIGNQCFENTLDGISMPSFFRCTIKENVCRQNSRHGISLDPSEHETQHDNEVVLICNQCDGNSNCGMFLSGSMNAEVHSNECYRNQYGGIVIRKAAAPLGSEMEINVQKNRCFENSDSGIIIADSRTSVIAKNECWANESYGVCIVSTGDGEPTESGTELSANKCHDNRKQGVILFASTYKHVSKNECWNNHGGGIAYSFLNLKGESNSAIDVSQNHCYENHDTGIYLAAISQGLIFANECWGNISFGILSNTTQDNVLKQRPTVHFFKNRSHHNSQVGIDFEASITDSASSNECWLNGEIGILVEHLNTTNDDHSDVIMKGNKAHSNGVCGFGCHPGVTLHAEQNCSGRNPNVSSYVGRNGALLNPLDWDLRDLDETEEETKLRLRKGSPWGETATALADAGFRDPDELACFCFNSGALGSLQRWQGTEFYKEIDETNDAQHEPGAGLYALSVPEEADRTNLNHIRFSATPGKSLRDAIWQPAQDLVLKELPGVTVIGAFGDCGTGIEDVIAEARAIHTVNVDNVKPGTRVPGGSAEMIRKLGFTSTTIRAPVTFDYDERAQMALLHETPERAFLEPSPPTGWKAVRDRMTFLLRDRSFMSLLGGGMAAIALLLLFLAPLKGYTDPLSDPLGAMLHTLHINLQDMQATDYLGLLSIFAGIAGVAGLLNRFLPVHLKITPPGWLRRIPWISRSPEDGQSAKRSKPWRKWVFRRIYGSDDACFLILRNVREWLDEDREALREIIAMRPEGTSLTIVIDAPSRTFLDRALLRALSDTDENVLELDGMSVDVFLGSEPGFLALSGGDDGIPFNVLMGIRSEDHTLRRDQIVADIVRQDLSVADIIPMLALGSTHFAPFRFSRRTSASDQRFQDDVISELSPFAEFFRTDTAQALNIALLDTITEMAYESDALSVHKRRVDRIDYLDLFGRPQIRNALSQALSEAFGTDDLSERQRIEYVIYMLMCGELFALRQVILDTDPVHRNRPRLNRAIASMLSALFLNQEIAHLQTAFNVDADTLDHARGILDNAWQAALEKLDTIKIEDPDTNQVHAGARLFALCQRGRQESGVMDASQDFDNLGDSFLADCFRSAIASWHDEFTTVDRKLAFQRSEGAMRLIASDLPSSLYEIAEAKLKRARMEGIDLANIFDAISTVDELADVIERHADIADDVFATLMITLARNAEMVEQQVSLAHFVQTITDRGLILGPGASVRGVTRGLGVPFDSFLEFAENEKVMAALGAALKSKNDAPYRVVDLLYGSVAEIKGAEGETLRLDFHQ